jgi:hypothetical protein
MPSASGPHRHRILGGVETRGVESMSIGEAGWIYALGVYMHFLIIYVTWIRNSFNVYLLDYELDAELFQ